MPTVSGLVVTSVGAVPIVSENTFVLTMLLASVTLAVKLNGLPVIVVGVPLNTPAEDSDVPVGTAPVLTLQVSGVVPAGLAVKVCEYAIPSAPSGSGLAVVMAGAEFTVIVIASSAVFVPSVAWHVQE